MGLFDKIFKSQREIAKEEIKEVDWHPLTRMEQLEEMEKESASQPVALFKHSTSCGVSAFVRRRLESSLKKDGEGVSRLYFLDLLAHRDISNEVARRWGVQHESPQLIILRNGKVVEHASHSSISASMIQKQE